MDAARQLFLKRGFHAASIAQIAQAADIAAQQMYRDFGSKEGIVSAIVEKDIASLFTAIDSAIAEAGQGREALRRWLYDLVMQAIEPDSGDLRAEIFAEAQRNELIATLLLEVEQRIRTAVATVVSAYSPSGRSTEEQAISTELIILLISTGGAHLRAARGVSATVMAARLAEVLEKDITGD
jgi:AcrR family transcriptional regulator